MKQKRQKYDEGQWFAVPLRTGGYGLGIIVRGNYKTKICLGYFFGPKFSRLPNNKDIDEKKSEDAVLITWFGDLGMINKRWPLIDSSRPFSRAQWPMPKFGRQIPLLPEKGYIVEYEENRDGKWKVLREIPIDVKEIAGLPEDIIRMGGSVEITLTKLLS